MSYDNFDEELMARMRRVETRLTIFMEHQGVPIQVRRPELLANGSIKIPTKGTSIQEILTLVGDEPTIVMCNGVRLCLITKV